MNPLPEGISLGGWRLGFDTPLAPPFLGGRVCFLPSRKRGRFYEVKSGVCCFLEPELEIYTPLAPLFRGEGFVAGVWFLTPPFSFLLLGVRFSPLERGEDFTK